MDLNKIGKNILIAFGILVAIAGTVGAIYLTMFVVTIVLGSVYKVAEDGTLPITDGANATLAGLETSYNTAIGSVDSGAIFAASLIPIAVILIIFGGIVALGVVAYKKRKDKNDGGY